MEQPNFRGKNWTHWYSPAHGPQFLYLDVMKNPSMILLMKWWKLNSVSDRSTPRQQIDLRDRFYSKHHQYRAFYTMEKLYIDENLALKSAVLNSIYRTGKHQVCMFIIRKTTQSQRISYRCKLPNRHTEKDRTTYRYYGYSRIELGFAYQLEKEKLFNTTTPNK